MISFKNDYSDICCKEVYDHVAKYYGELNKPYLEDYHTERATDLIRNKIEDEDALVQLLSTGTQTNHIVAAAFLRPHEAILAVKSAHINVHETGAVEATGHRIIGLEGLDGKVTPRDIEHIFDPDNLEFGSIYNVKPRMVYISHTTEIGTSYTKKELKELRETCDKYGLLLYCDGARLACGLSSSDIGFPTLAKLCDAFYIGGAKNGAMFGEALVITNESLKKDFTYIVKQRGGLLAKGFILGLQFEALMTDNLYENNGRKSNEKADLLREGLKKLDVEFAVENKSNQIFIYLDNGIYESLIKEFDFEEISREDGRIMSRLVTSWYTKEEWVDKFIERLSHFREQEDVR